MCCTVYYLISQATTYLYMPCHWLFLLQCCANYLVEFFTLHKPNLLLTLQALQQDLSDAQASLSNSNSEAAKARQALTTSEATNADLTSKLRQQALALQDSQAKITTLQADLRKAAIAAKAPDFNTPHPAISNPPHDPEKDALLAELQDFKLQKKDIWDKMLVENERYASMYAALCGDKGA